MCINKKTTFLYNVNCCPMTITGAVSSLSSKFSPNDILRDFDKQWIVVSILDINMSLIKSQRLICKSNNLAAFRTPFYSATGDPIYALLKENENREVAPQPYTLIDFVVEGQGSGKLLKKFPSLPLLPAFAKDRSEYLYDPALNAPTVDYPHVFERLDKLPGSFLSTMSGIFGVDSKDLTVNETAAKVRELVRNVPMADQMFRSLFSGAVAAAAKEAAADPYLARAIYYPRRGRVSLLLPLRFCNKGKADCALVVTKEASGYVGQTILSLDEAYRDARLLGNVESTWLIPSATKA